MKSVIYELQAPGKLIGKELVIDATNDDDILAQTVYSVVSTGTEIAAWKGLPPLRPSVTYPRLVGYCNLAQVLEVGAKIEDIQVGEYILTHQSHRSAFKCKRQEILYHTRISDPKMLKNLTATYIYHLGYTALLCSQFKPGFHVAIVGLGTIGMATADLISIYGLEPFIFTNQNKFELCRKIGYKKYYSKNLFDIKEVNLFTHMEGVDLVINTSNAWEDYLLSLKLARKGGEIVCIGFPGRGEALPDFNPLDTQYFYDKQISIKHCGYVTEADVAPIDVRFTLKRNMTYLANLIISKCLDPTIFLNLESQWDRLSDVYNKLSNKKNYYSAIINWK